MDDACVRDGKLSTHDDHSLENSHKSEEQTSPVTHSPNEEEHNKGQHQPENEDRHLLKLKLNEMADQCFLDFFHRTLSI